MRRILALTAGLIATAVLLTLALPLGEQAWMGWFAFVPLIAACRDQRIVIGVLTALASVFLAAGLAWSGLLYGHRSAGEAIPIFGACGKFAIIAGAAVALSSDTGAWRRPAWFFAAVATLVEGLQILDIPAHLALSQYRNVGLLQVSSLGGVWIVSFLLWWSNFHLARLPVRVMAPWLVGIVTAATLAGHIGPHAQGPVQQFAALQIADPDEKLLLNQQRRASITAPEFVVWPEFAGMVFGGAADESLRQVSSQAGMAPFITSIEDVERPRPHNVAALFAAGRESSRYAKRKLFGGETAMHTLGTRPVAVPYRDGVVGLCICFDSCFPEAIRETARLPHVDVIALPSVDPPAANDFMSAMHAAYTPFRCAESGIAIVRSDGHAYSQIVDATGRIVAELGPGDGILKARLPVGRRWSLYRLAGDWFLVAAGLLFVVGWRIRPTQALDPAPAPEPSSP